MKQFITRSGILILLLFSSAAFASHIAGGVITYQCLGSDQYKVTFKFYRDCTGSSAPDPAQIDIYNSSDALVQTLSLPLISTVTLPANSPNPCTTVPTGICIEEITYTGNVTLPPISGGYQLTFELCCRNPGIVNGPANSSAYSTWIPDVSKATCNSSAVYASAPPMFVCSGLPLSYDHSATDPDGDVLTYSLCTAIESAVPLTNYPYSSPYTASNPLGGGLTINPTTGLITGTPSTLGKFVVGICVTETRNGVVINTTTRDFQWNVVDCQVATVASALSALTNCQTREVTFFNSSTGGVSYQWSFGDGQTSTTAAVTPLPHTYTSLGTYNVTLISFATNPLCNDTVKSLVTVVDTCRPCGMNVNITPVDGVCNPTSGCTQVKYVHPCSGSVSINYGGTVFGSCGGGSNSNGSGGAPTTATITVNGVTLPSAATTTTYTPLPQYTTKAACPKTITTNGSGGTITITMNLWMSQPQTGGATTAITGGTSPYTINWTTTPGQTGPSATNVNPGTYSAIVTDANGCTEVRTFTVNGNSSLNFTASKTDVTGCGLNNGTLSVTGVTGSTGTVTYTWSPGGWTTANVSNVAPGTYMVTVNDGAGCPKATSVTVGGVPAITVNATITDATCSYSANGSATASASGGQAPYTYSWNTSPVKTGATVTGLAKGFYTVIATDANGCKGSFSFTVAAPPALALTVSKINPSCFNGTNGTATVSASGGTGTKSYSWNSTPVQNVATATGLKAGTYTITVTDANGCTASSSVTLTNPPAIIHDILNTSTMSCAGVFVGKAQETASGGTGVLTYNWTPGNPTGDGTASVTGLTAGTWTCTVTDANGCIATDAVTITDPGILSVTATSTPTCGGTNNGTAIVTPSGGIGPYTYSWSPGGATTQNISNLAAGVTYTATVTDIGGCPKTASVTIASTPALVPGTTMSGCGNNVSIDLSVTGGTSPYTYVWAHGPTTQDVTGLSAATYTVTVWDVNNCYVTSATTVPVISCNPIVVADPVTICNGTCGTITATGSVGVPPYTYTWSPATGLSATTGVSVSACPASTTTYTIIIRDNIAATASTTVVVTVNPNPTVTVPPAIICAGSSTPLTASGAVTYTWSPSTGLSATTGTSVTAGPSDTTTYTVIGSFATGCTGTTTVIVTVNPVPVVSVPNAFICPGGSIPLTANGATTYTWSPATGLNATSGTTVTASPASTATYTVCGTANNCSSCTTVTVTVGAIVATTLPNDTICFGTCTNLLAGGGTTYSWSPTTGLSDPNSSNPVACPTVTTTYTVNVSNGTCSDDTVVIITVNSAIVLNVAGRNVTCFGACNGQTSVTASGGTSPYTYNWSGGCTTATCNNVCAGSYTVTVTDAVGCTATGSVTLTQPTVLLSSLTGKTDVSCFGQCNGTAGVTATGGTPSYTYSWLPGGGTAANVTSLCFGSYTCTVTDANNCSVKTSVSIIQPEQVVVSATNPRMCPNTSATITANGSGGTNPITYTWNPGGLNGSTVTVSPTATRTYTVTGTDSVGCTGTAMALVTVDTTPVINVPADTICQGTSTSLTASGANTYTWATATGLSATNGTTVTANPDITTTYTVTGTSDFGCTGTTTVILTVNMAPDVTSTSGSICPGEDTTLTASGAETYVWSPANTLSSGTGSTVTSRPAITTTYTLIGTGLNGCTSSIPVEVTVNSNPVPAFITSPHILDEFNPTVYFYDQSTGGIINSWLWNFGDTANTSSTVQNPVFVYPPVSNTYLVQLIVANESGCIDSTTGIVYIRGIFTFYIPNSFTPNGDGNNDVFLPKGVGIDETDYDLWIFDRWGNLVWHTDIWGEAWHGRTNGGSEIAQIDTYVWKVHIKEKESGNKHNYIGHVNIVK